MNKEKLNIRKVNLKLKINILLFLENYSKIKNEICQQEVKKLIAETQKQLHNLIRLTIMLE